MTETARSMWLYLKGRNQLSSWACIWVCVCAPAQGTKPRDPQRGTMTLRLHQATGSSLFPAFSGGSNFASVLDFRRTTLPLFCGWPGASSRLPNPPPPALERNKHAQGSTHTSS